MEWALLLVNINNSPPSCMEIYNNNIILAESGIKFFGVADHLRHLFELLVKESSRLDEEGYSIFPQMSSEFLVIPDSSRKNDPVNEVYSQLKEQEPKVKETLLILERALDDYG